MKHILLFALLTIISVPALAEDNVIIIRRDDDRVINLPGNAQIRTNDNDSNIYIKRRYGTSDLIYNRFFNPYPERRDLHNVMPTNDISAICGGVDKQSDRRKCRRDVMDEHEKLYKKYN